MMNSVASVHRKYSIRNTLVEPQQCCSICPHRNSGSAQYNHCSYYSCVWVCNSCAACWLQSENNISISCVGAKKWKNVFSADMLYETREELLTCATCVKESRTDSWRGVSCSWAAWTFSWSFRLSSCRAKSSSRAWTSSSSYWHILCSCSSCSDCRDEIWKESNQNSR